MRELTFDDDGARFGRCFVHWSILFSRSSRSSNRLSQNPAIWLVQSISGAKRAELRAVVRLAAFVAVAHQPGLLQDAEMLRDGRLRDPGPRRQRPDRLLSFAAQPLEDAPAGSDRRAF